jgi:hypothetical protein
VFRKIIEALKRKRLNAMTALLKFLVLLALFLLASHANVFTSLSSVAGNQIRVNHLIRLQQPMSNLASEPSCKPICKLPNNLSQKKS